MISLPLINPLKKWALEVFFQPNALAGESRMFLSYNKNPPEPTSDTEQSFESQGLARTLLSPLGIHTLLKCGPKAENQKKDCKKKKKGRGDAVVISCKLY